MRYHSLVLAVILLFATLSTGIASLVSSARVADAYILWSPNETCVYPSSTITWKNVSLTSQHLTDTRIAIAFWNDIGANFFLDATTGTGNINYYSVDRSDVDWAGLGAPPGNCSGGVYSGSGSATLNSYYLGSNRDLIQATAGHETGHALGLEHTQSALQGASGRELMWPIVGTSIIAPTLDDIRAVQTKYGTRTSTSQCNEWNTNGDVTYTGTCSGTNPALPMTEKVTTSASNSKAVATTSSSTTSLPSNGAFVMTAIVKANTVNKFIMGAFTNTDISNTLNRFMAIEMSSDGFYLMSSSGSGYVRTQIHSSAPTVGQEYFLELVIRDGQSSRGYVFKNNGSATDPPDSVGSVATNTAAMAWSTSVYYGSGVWQTSAAQPKPDYTISKYYNLLRSYT